MSGRKEWKCNKEERKGLHIYPDEECRSLQASGRFIQRVKTVHFVFAFF